MFRAGLSSTEKEFNTRVLIEEIAAMYDIVAQVRYHEKLGVSIGCLIQL